MQLGVRQDSVIQFDRRAFDGVDAIGAVPLCKQISLSMVIVHRLGIVGQERRTSEDAYRQNQI
jgi:hypothetical protein